MFELANNIKDEELRKKVIDFLKNPKIDHPELEKYGMEDIEKVKVIFNVSGIGSVERNLLEHIISLTELCMSFADNLERNFGISLNKDMLIAAALLHDLMKVYEWKQTSKGTEYSGISLDHSMLAVAELYKRKFPEHLIHIVASHYGETGPTPPRTLEALVFHHLDSMLSLIEAYVSSLKQPKKTYLILDEETLKNLAKDEK